MGNATRLFGLLSLNYIESPVMLIVAGDSFLAV